MITGIFVFVGFYFDFILQVHLFWSLVETRKMRSFFIVDIDAIPDQCVHCLVSFPKN